MTDDVIDSMQYFVDTFLQNTSQEIKTAARQSGKSQWVNYVVQQLNMSNIGPSIMPKWGVHGTMHPLIIMDDLDISDRLMPEPKEKDWECKIPHHDPFYRTFSSPSEKTRAKARAKRKKK